eukprot:5077343-Prymnesium_polylepis.1
MMTKVWKDTERKWDLLRRWAPHVLHVFVPTPAAPAPWANQTGVRCGFLPFVGGEPPRPLVNRSGVDFARDYAHDVAMTGAMAGPGAVCDAPPGGASNVSSDWCGDGGYTDGVGGGRCKAFEARLAHYPPLRREMICAIPALQAAGLRVVDTAWAAGYEELVATSKIVPATSELGLHLGGRVMTVLASGHALLIADREPSAYAHLGVVRHAAAAHAAALSRLRPPTLAHHHADPPRRTRVTASAPDASVDLGSGEHAVFVGSRAEFIRKVRHYADPAHEPERMRMVQAAARLMERAPLRRLAVDAVQTIRDALDARRGARAEGEGAEGKRTSATTHGSGRFRMR